MTRKKAMIVAAIAVFGAFGGYKFGFAKEAEKKPSKIHGDVYILVKDFIVYLADGHYANLVVTIVVDIGAVVLAVD